MRRLGPGRSTMQIRPVTGAELAAEMGRRWDGSHALLDRT
jgi:hypothetical protein